MTFNLNESDFQGLQIIFKRIQSTLPKKDTFGTSTVCPS